ncbi:tetratricopeptide repeat protein [Parabacteroides sp. Marseille-P3160]|uniref:tetratricopeptide repeat protein n=1 Tax=Parabacteroides sp. Marseille-P3160 TaxID=1917887 RepID=UPI0009BA49DD|nr:tetratricopeptide repeat protein [Parabacteroides sp. Marseille-P3160]
MGLKTFLYDLFFLCLLGFYTFSCRESPEKPSGLVQAEKIMDLHPDSALRLLKRIPSPEKLSKENYATWCLLVTQAEDKNYIKHTSDSLIIRALSYFEKQKDPERKAKALFYAGQVYTDLNQPEKAVSYYLQAREFTETTDYHFLSQICSNLGMNYAYRSELKDQAKPWLKEAYNYAVQSKDSSSISRCLSDLGRVYGQYEEWDSVAYFYQEAMKIAAESQNYREYAIAKGEISRAYIRLGKSRQAIESLQEAKTVRIKYNLGHLAQADLSLGDIYRRIGNNDSAVYYLKKALEADNIYTLWSAYWYLYNLEKMRKDYKAAIDYNELYLTYADSIQHITHQKELLEIQKKYDHEKLLNVNNQLIMEKDKLTKGTLLVFLFAICLFAFYQRKLFRKEQYIRRIEKKIQDYSAEVYKNEMIIQHNKELIESLSFQQEEGSEADEHWIEIAEMQRKNDRLQQENKELQEKIQAHLHSLQIKEADNAKIMESVAARTTTFLRREKQLTSLLEERLEALKDLRSGIHRIEEEQWVEIIKSVNLLYDNFTERLQVAFPTLSPVDIQYCCLIKLRLPLSVIATLMSVAPASVTKRKQRIRDHINEQSFHFLADKRSVETFLWEF